MARFIIIAMARGKPVTYLYEESNKALAKSRALLNRGNTIEIKDGATGLPLTIADLEKSNSSGSE